MTPHGTNPVVLLIYLSPELPRELNGRHPG